MTRNPEPGTRNSAYGAFAYAYDRALGERFFRSARRVLTKVLDRYPTLDKTHLDLACGTGLALQFFRSRGWQSVGLDASLAMLSVAKSRSSSLVAADFAALPFRRTFSRVTCLYDSLNHVRDRADLASIFSATRAVMSSESMFLFDMNHPDAYPEVWGMTEPFVAEGEGFHLEIATAYRRRDSTGLAHVTGWALMPDGTRVEISEHHEQRAYTQRDILQCLAKAGLTPVDVIDFDPFQDSTDGERGIKLFFVCRPS